MPPRTDAYVLAGSDGPAAITPLATGSEVALAMRAREMLGAEGIASRVVSMPNCGEFDRQSADYRATVLPRALPVLAIEAGVSHFWRAYTGLTPQAIYTRACALVQGKRSS